MWMHTRDYSGGYVFIKNRNGKTIPLDILLNAGNLAVYHSKARKNGSADLYYTQVKHLRRAKNAPKGTVLPTNEKNLSIKLENSRLKIMEEAKTIWQTYINEAESEEVQEQHFNIAKDIIKRVFGTEAFKLSQAVPSQSDLVELFIDEMKEIME